MTDFRVAVHYSFKNGMEEQGIKMVEKDIFELLRKNGCVSIEAFQDEEKRGNFFYLAHWKSLDDAHKVQAKWEEKEKAIKDFCTNVPHREFFKMRNSH